MLYIWRSRSRYVAAIFPHKSHVKIEFLVMSNVKEMVTLCISFYLENLELCVCVGCVGGRSAYASYHISIRRFQSSVQLLNSPLQNAHIDRTILSSHTSILEPGELVCVSGIRRNMNFIFVLLLRSHSSEHLHRIRQCKDANNGRVISYQWLLSFCDTILEYLRRSQTLQKHTRSFSPSIVSSKLKYNIYFTPRFHSTASMQENECTSSTSCLCRCHSFRRFCWRNNVVERLIYEHVYFNMRNLWSHKLDKHQTKLCDEKILKTLLICCIRRAAMDRKDHEPCVLCMKAGRGRASGVARIPVSSAHGKKLDVNCQQINYSSHETHTHSKHLCAHLKAAGIYWKLRNARNFVFVIMSFVHTLCTPHHISAKQLHAIRW